MEITQSHQILVSGLSTPQLYLFILLSIYLSIYLFIYLIIHLFIGAGACVHVITFTSAYLYMQLVLDKSLLYRHTNQMVCNSNTYDFGPVFGCHIVMPEAAEEIMAFPTT